VAMFANRCTHFLQKGTAKMHTAYRINCDSINCTTLHVQTHTCKQTKIQPVACLAKPPSKPEAQLYFGL
jgi:hypothetical protein